MNTTSSSDSSKSPTPAHAGVPQSNQMATTKLPSLSEGGTAAPTQLSAEVPEAYPPPPVSFPPVTSAALPSPHTQTETAPSQDTAASSTLETPTHHANSPYDLSTEYHNNDPAATSPAPSQDEAAPAPRPETPDRLIGTVIDDRYRIETRIARGGMATVYKAHDSRLDRHVALKIMYPHLAESQEFVTRFRREARAAAKLTHPGVVAVYDQGTTEGSSYLVMELVKGPNLRTYLRSHGCLKVGRSLEITAQILSALSTAHRQGLIHRDVKPENVLLPKDSSVKVADFGLARAASEVTAATTGSILGTVAYLSPETVSGHVADARVDVYAVGIMLYEMLTGVVPFTGDTPIQIAYAHVNQDIPRLREDYDWVPQPVDDLVARLTSRDPAQRPVDATVALELVEQTLAQLDSTDLELRGQAEPVEVNEPNFDSGQMATPTLVEVPLPAPQPHNLGEGNPGSRTATKSGKLLPILITIAGVLLVGLGIGWYLLLGPGSYDPVPDVVNQQWATASGNLEKAKLNFVRVEEFSDTVAAGNVSRTVPGAGDEVWRFGEVKVYVSKGIQMLDVPDLSKTAKDQLKQVVTKAGFAAPTISEAYHDTVPAGQVISQEPAANTNVAHNTVIKVTVSKGREPVVVPSLEGKLRDEAVTMLHQAGLQAAVTEEYSDDVARGTVMRQDAAANTTLYRNDTVPLVVSRGPRTVTVPSVRGKSEAAATQALESLGLKVKITRIYSVVGVVAESDPAAGTEVEVGATVTLKMI